MKEYKYLKDALNEFSSDLEYSLEEYKNSFETLISTSPDYASELQKEILEAMKDPEWDWVDVANEMNFIGSDDNKDSVVDSVDELIWKVINPNQALRSS